jgi:hypothetical protein
MFSNLISTVKTTVARPVDTRVIVFVLMLALFVLGAGAPGASGGMGG